MRIQAEPINAATMRAVTEDAIVNQKMAEIANALNLIRTAAMKGERTVVLILRYTEATHHLSKEGFTLSGNKDALWVSW